jgi:hypothetical protein
VLGLTTDGGSAISFVQNLFGALIGNGAFASDTYFNVDNLSAFYLPNLDTMATSLYELVRNTADSDSVSILAFNSDKGNSLNQADMENVIIMFETLLVESQLLPAPAAQTFAAVVGPLLQNAQLVVGLDLTGEVNQGYALQLSRAAVGLVLSLDFFNEGYPEGEAFLDQTFQAGDNIVNDESSPTAQPTTRFVPTALPTTEPAPTSQPTNRLAPTAQPTTEVIPTSQPTTEPSPTSQPTSMPAPTAHPMTELVPTAQPTVEPAPTSQPTNRLAPTAQPTPEPSLAAQLSTEFSPTAEPTTQPMTDPTPTSQLTTEPSPSVDVTRNTSTIKPTTGPTSGSCSMMRATVLTLAALVAVSIGSIILL